MDVLTLIGAIGLSYIGYLVGFWLYSRFKDLLKIIFGLKIKREKGSNLIERRYNSSPARQRTLQK
jgi:hypothetical protein